MKWNKVTTDKFGDVLFWDGNELVYLISYDCFENHSEFGNAGWISGFSSSDGFTDCSDFCG